MLALIKSVQTFDEVFVLTGGGPGTATQLIVQYIYSTAFATQVHNFGLAAAASIVLGSVAVHPHADPDGTRLPQGKAMKETLR